ncbi:CehA/McbA family metallohydrolase [bacterium]|nr:CehA/McbA family metallohydrolase [bacterium]
MNSEYHEMTGAVHLHSDFSDGTLSIPEIASIAGEKGLNYLMFSDHNTLAPKHQGLEGWYGDVLVLIGCELNDPHDRNHYLAFRIDREIAEGQWPEQYVRQVREAGGFGVIAHPAEKRNFSEAYPPYPWTAWHVDGFDGIEIWNQLSEWAEGVTRRNLLWRLLHPLRSIRFPVWETLERWDQLNRGKRIVGIGGIDVHAHRFKVFKLFPVEIYPYKVQFKSIRTHLLVKADLNPEMTFRDAESHVYEALSQGRCFISNHSLGDACDFRFSAVSSDKCYPMGSRLVNEPPVRLLASMPAKASIRLLWNGSIIREAGARVLEHQVIRPGVYRIEVFRKRRGWIYSNPIVVEPGAND